jgi:predicted phosphoribosyltransferase
MQAGRMLASMIAPKYRYENCVVVALDDGGVMVGSQIAIQLHCIITMVISQEITLPREIKALGGITADGDFTYNNDFSKGEIDEFVAEYRGYIEEERIEKYHEINRLLGNGGLITPKTLKHMNVILVSDGLLDSGMRLDLAMEFLKPIEIESLVVATPLASVEAIDKIHVMADAVFCLSVLDEHMNTNHYYDKNDVPDHKKIIETLENIILKWK